MLRLADSHCEAIPTQPGLVNLPAELILEITSHLPPTCSVPQRSGADATEECDCRVRQYALRALSRTCRSLRRISVDLAWEHVELNRGTTQTRASSDCSDLGLSHRSELLDAVVPTMQFLSHVRVLKVHFGPHSTTSTFRHFFNTLELLPKLNAVQVSFPPRNAVALRVQAMTQQDAWKPTRALDSIEHWYSSHVLFPIIAICPNLRSLGGVAGDAVNLVKCISRLPCSLPLIERLENVVVHPLFPRLSVVENIAHIATMFPNIRALGWSSPPHIVYKELPFELLLNAFPLLEVLTVSVVGTESLMLSEHRWKLWIETLGQLNKTVGPRMRRKVSVILKAEGRTTVSCRAYKWTFVP